MQTLTIDWIKNNGLLIFEVIAGSKAYGLDTTTSDTDIKGVFVLPKNLFYGLEYTKQVNNETNDIVTSVLILIKDIQLIIFLFFEILYLSLLKQLINGHFIKNGDA